MERKGLKRSMKELWAAECCGIPHPQPQCEDCPMHDWEEMTVELGTITSVEQMYAVYRKRS